MTKYDQISSGVSHRPITEGMGESSSRNYVFFYLYILRKKIEFLKNFELLNFLNFFIFVTSDERGGVMPIYGKWVCIWLYMGTPQRHGDFGLTKMSPSLLLLNMTKL